MKVHDTYFLDQFINDAGLEEEDETKDEEEHAPQSVQVTRGAEKVSHMYATPPVRVHGGRKVKKNGNREEVWAGIALKTKGGLAKADLMQVKSGVNRKTDEVYYKIVSKKRSENAKKIFHSSK